MRARVCVIHWHCTAQLSMFNMEKRYRNKIIIIIIIIFSRDCMEISLFGSSEVYRSRPDVLGRSDRGPARTFSDVAPGKELKTLCCA